MKGVTLTPLRRIPTPGGDVFHALKCSDVGFSGFGEAYMSAVDYRVVKGWKRHRRMIMNLAVVCGSARFIVVDEETRRLQAFDLSAEDSSHYARLTVSPGLWMAFGGLGRALNLVLNIASIEHDPDEAERAPLGRFAWAWDQLE